ncbi:hypothetical protein ESB00_17395 [Oleiharenicola lentus]|uniref:Uncharacterized protein n=1 Tax=Oleiharenicola lentus TaxID=2508720 RepID=A0A4Q1C4W3_9BACT|nr:hypothetical protein [Oleiharenicola lentus]RXK53467.1 hypothetical protein ESB00_17395 [Oleiharenicola lentus]
MNHPNLDTAINDLIAAIRNITLGSVEGAVIEAAGRELILNWKDSNGDDPFGPIDEGAELELWANRQEKLASE